MGKVRWHTLLSLIAQGAAASHAVLAPRSLKGVTIWSVTTDLDVPSVLREGEL